ncbi:MAG: YiiX/YebB-like N1pC/P60 family cysteine hydrolase [Hyphomicrobium sp.]|nr:YiiX/YebB-like N1pC/P60 family cysteine hydrolase [Hyphomicrobium sp.]
MTLFDRVLDRIGHFIAKRLERPLSGYQPYTPSDPETLRRVLKPADVLLIEGNQKVSSAIKYLTQSTWSHAALYVGDALGSDAGEPCMLIEANLGYGVVAVPLSKYASFNTRICRAVGLTDEDMRRVVAFATTHLGDKYDTRNIVDLARYLLPTPPVPVRWRRRMLALGSGEPTRVICSTLIAQAFQSIRYPILPRVERLPGEERAESAYSRREIHHIRHHSLFVPRDFDLSPYFRVVKPTIEAGFNHRGLRWAGGEMKAAAAGAPL